MKIMSKHLVIVESPAKAKTIEKYLGKDYQVLASFGHIRDLPSKDGSVDPAADFAMKWALDKKAQGRIKEIEKALKASDTLILATDPDREGEAISWHLLEVLNRKGALKDKSIERIAFNAITQKSIREAIAQPRNLDMQLVEAYLARRALDYLVGFTLSPVLWRKLPGSRSAGRVQSVSLRLICEREIEIEKFRSQEYWQIESQLQTPRADMFSARLVKLEGQKLEKFSLQNKAQAEIATQAVKQADLKITTITSKPVQRKPYAPFQTSTLQQEASHKLGFSATHTMRIAQSLYEGIDIGGETVGLITYMRTDGISTASEALTECRKMIQTLFGDNYLPKSPRLYKTKAKNAQEAHEAIRPTEFHRHPDKLPLNKEQKQLYDLIWRRAMASQMQAAQLERTVFDIQDTSGRLSLRANGQVIRFDGFLKLYDIPEADQKKGDADDDRHLPPASENETVTAQRTQASQHFTQPPSRYSEASLVKKMEELGIGRPSTYASTLKLLQDRNYVRLEKRRFIPDDRGRLVTAFLENFFTRYIQYDYTADLETQLDRVSAGDLDWKHFLRDFWTQFAAHVETTKGLRVSEVLDTLNEALKAVVFIPHENGQDPRKCTHCKDGKLSLKVGRFGAFIGCSNYPDCNFTRPFGQQDSANTTSETPERHLGQNPETGEDIYFKSGRFGPYVQIGETQKGEKPKRMSIPKSWSPEMIDLAKALKLLSLPREIGIHPQDGEIIQASLGRYGPYILHKGAYANLESVDEVFNIGLNRAVSLLVEKHTRGSGRRNSSKTLKSLGLHPDLKTEMNLMDGRYGPYVKCGQINATLPKNMAPDQLTKDMAIDFIRQKQARSATQKTPKK